ncbi:YhgE/Pip domain-containing protein [Bacillus sp. B1-b2]|uniref:YhgE/Pip domain-containing protein n=1 Tax=Bacillus sp. B1-b2 TaxID=2653201 RepID=UPI0012628EDA|nr:ABC transporter permease [Bacillus sp. B1-b2]KAB7665906.1 ABC transporter permease [Bacillus sp. B1-b2]
MFKTIKAFLGILQTKIGIVFAILVPLLFTVIWMTGYNGATDRVDQLNVGIVNEDGQAGENISASIAKGVPFTTENYASLSKAKEDMDAGKLVMIIEFPTNFASNIGSHSETSINYYVNKANSEVAVSIAESAAEQITATVNKQVVQDNHQDLVTTNLEEVNGVDNFAITMLPMVLGFVTYIGVMTMNIQFNLSSQFLKKSFSKWDIFWARQILMLIIAVVGSFIVTNIALLFVDPMASYLEMWGFHILVYIASMCVTQMAFALFGGVGALFNVALIPFQLMTAGNIIPSEMLTPFYRHIGSFLPASNAIQGYMRLINSGSTISTYIIHLLLIAAVTWGITVLRTALTKPAVKMATNPVAH